MQSHSHASHSHSSASFSVDSSRQVDTPNAELGRDIIHLVGADHDVAEVVLDKKNIVISFKKRTRRLYDLLGKGVALCFAIGCGVTAAAALATLVAGPVFYVLAGILCLSTTYANYYMTTHDVSNIFVTGIKGLFQKEIIIEAEVDVKTISAPREYLSRGKMALLAGGIVLSLSFGLVFGALTYGSTLALVSAFTFLGAVSFALPPIGIILGVLTFICLSALMIKAFSDLIKQDNIKDKIVSKIKSIFATSEQDREKSRTYVWCKKLLIGLSATALVVGVFGLVIWGQISTLGNCAREFGKILTAVTHASAIAAEITSKVIGIGLALAAQIPFILKTSVQPIIKLFTPSPKTAAPKTTVSEKVKSVLLVMTAFLSATATATIALKGKALEIFPVLAGMGAFLNNFLGTVINATISQPIAVQPQTQTQDSHIQHTRVLKPHPISTTAVINNKLAQADTAFMESFVFDRSPEYLLNRHFTLNEDHFTVPPSPTKGPEPSVSVNGFGSETSEETSRYRYFA